MPILPPPSKPVAKARGRVAGIGRAIHAGELPADTPALDEAKRDLRAELLADRVAKAISGWPPLSDEQCERIASILITGSRNGGGDVNDAT